MQIRFLNVTDAARRRIGKRAISAGRGGQAAGELRRERDAIEISYDNDIYFGSRAPSDPV